LIDANYHGIFTIFCGGVCLCQGSGNVFAYNAINLLIAHTCRICLDDVSANQCSACLKVFDGIKNELYLLNNGGEFLDNSSKHGEQKIELSGFGARGFSITTFLVNYLIKYNKCAD
jgi:hypothetical protein